MVLTVGTGYVLLNLAVRHIFFTDLGILTEHRRTTENVNMHIEIDCIGLYKSNLASTTYI